jgi:transposase
MSKGIITTEQRQKQVISRLKNENAFLRIELKKRDVQIACLEEKLEKSLLHIEELQKYVFRGKKKPGDEKDGKPKGGRSAESGRRDNSSYRKAVPNESEITNEEAYAIETCPHCQAKLTKLKILEFYEEDALPLMDWFKVLKKITRKKITTGYCPSCQKKVAAAPIPKQKVSLGQNIRQLIVFQNTIEQFSYSQILDFAENCLHLKISEGEIAKIIADQANKLKPAYEDLLKSIRRQPAIHLDETSWNIAFPDAFGGNFAWAMTGSSETGVVYAFGKNRGQGNARALLGDEFHGVGVTDDYNAYKNIFDHGRHALCWAHPDRKIRDLGNSEKLSPEKKELCRQTSERFSALYKRVREISAAAFVKEDRLKEELLLKKDFQNIVSPNKNDPGKLASIKRRLKEQIDCYFVCITSPGIPPDNNKAERMLRHLVIKRKKSFGSKTPQGADVMSTLYSVVMSLWFRSKKDFFRAYSEALSC